MCVFDKFQGDADAVGPRPPPHELLVDIKEEGKPWCLMKNCWTSHGGGGGFFYVDWFCFFRATRAACGISLPTPQPQQCQIWATSAATYTAARSEIRPKSSRILVGFITTKPQWELPDWFCTSCLKIELAIGWGRKENVLEARWCYFFYNSFIGT